MNILDVGCGNSKMPGAIGVDRAKNTQADVVHDLDVTPWPFEDNTFELIICNDVLEHLDNVIKTIEELHRIAKPGAILKVRVPHFSNCNTYGDVTHKRAFGVGAFDGFTGDSMTQSHYSDRRLKLVSMKLTFAKLNRIIGVFANLWPRRYERYFAFMFSAGNIEYELRVLK